MLEASPSSESLLRLEQRLPKKAAVIPDVSVRSEAGIGQELLAGPAPEASLSLPTALPCGHQPCPGISPESQAWGAQAPCCISERKTTSDTNVGDSEPFHDREPWI